MNASVLEPYEGVAMLGGYIVARLVVDSLRPCRPLVFSDVWCRQLWWVRVSCAVAASPVQRACAPTTCLRRMSRSVCRG